MPLVYADTVALFSRQLEWLLIYVIYGDILTPQTSSI